MVILKWHKPALADVINTQISTAVLHNITAQRHTSNTRSINGSLRQTNRRKKPHTTHNYYSSSQNNTQSQQHIFTINHNSHVQQLLLFPSEITITFIIIKVLIIVA